MGIAALVLGIISIIVGFIPFCGMIAYIPAIVGIILGIVDLVKKSKTGENKVISIVGIILSGVAILIITFWTLMLGIIAASESSTSSSYSSPYSSRTSSYYKY